MNDKRQQDNNRPAKANGIIRGLSVMVLLALVALLVIYRAGRSHLPEPAKDPIPTVQFKTSGGQDFDFAEIKNRITLLHLYDPECTGKCISVLPVLQQLDTKYRTTDDIVFIILKAASASSDSLLAGLPKIVDHRLFDLELDAASMQTLQNYLGKKGVYHSGELYLLDQQNYLRGKYDATNPESIKLMTRAVRALMEN